MEPTRITRASLAALVPFCAATVFLIPLEWWIPGLASWIVSAAVTLRAHDARLRRNLGVLLACVLVLAFAPIHTELEWGHFLVLFLFFLAVLAGPYLYMKRKAPGELRWRFWPRTASRRDIVYTLISLPLAWLVIEIYFFHLNPEVPSHWRLPPEHSVAAIRRLTVGINMVGIWDELFFINTVYALLRGVFPARIANLAQAVVYTSVLYDMAFTGHGVWIVYLFALTQGWMYEKSRVLLYVLIVHLIVDLMLVLAILQYAYPGESLPLFL